MESYTTFSISSPLGFLKLTEGGKALLLVRIRRSLERVTSLRFSLPAKAKSPREFTESGMITEVRLLS